MDLKRKKSRTKYTKTQIELLERIFDGNKYPDTETHDTLATELGVSTERVSIWFQNRRSKFKRQCHTSHVAWMRNQLFLTNENKEFVFGTPPPLPSNKPTCHVLSPLEYQVNRTDAVFEGYTSLNSSPITPFHERCNSLNSIQSDIPGKSYDRRTCADHTPTTTSGSCMLESRLHTQGRNLNRSSESPCIDFLSRDYNLDDRSSNNFLHVNEGDEISRNQHGTGAVRIGAIDKENTSPNIRRCTFSNKFRKVNLNNRLGNLDLDFLQNEGIQYTQRMPTVNLTNILGDLDLDMRQNEGTQTAQCLLPVSAQPHSEYVPCAGYQHTITTGVPGLAVLANLDYELLNV